MVCRRVARVNVVVAVQLSAKFDVGTQVGADVAVFILARSP
ncbi:hypothetical protein [Paenarthrobacter histidinolovorans]|nr:hypothetical protein [Paenarthrobacter histidinolovorans]